MAAAVPPNSLGTLRKHFTKPSEEVAAPLGSTPTAIVNLEQGHREKSSRSRSDLSLF